MRVVDDGPLSERLQAPFWWPTSRPCRLRPDTGHCPDQGAQETPDRDDSENHKRPADEQDDVDHGAAALPSCLATP